MKIKSYVLNSRNFRKSFSIFKRVLKSASKFNLRNILVRRYTPQKLIRLVHEDLPLFGEDINKLIKKFEKDFLPYCIAQSNPMYMAFPDSGNAISGLVGDIYKPFLNQNLIADKKSAPLGTYLEIQVIDWFRQLVGYKKSKIFPKDISQVGGMLSLGGVLSNVIALLVSRNKLFKDSFEKGLTCNDVCILVPESINHYSIDLAMGYLGLGSQNLEYVKLDSHFRMDLDYLKSKIKNIKSKNKKVLAVVSYAGDSRTMQIDHLKQISDICRKERIWFHVDACHGFSLLFSENQKKKLDGINLADSITFDPHKSLMLPYPCSLVLFKNPANLMGLSKDCNMALSANTYDLGQITPFIGSKSFESLKLWFLLKSMGLKNIGKIIDSRTNLTLFLKKLVDMDSDFVALNDVTINSLCFLFYPSSLKERHSIANKNQKKEIEKFLDRLNEKIQDKIYSNGSSCVHLFRLVDIGDRALLKNSGARQVLGIILGNARTTPKDIKNIFNTIKRLGVQIYNDEKENILGF